MSLVLARLSLSPHHCTFGSLSCTHALTQFPFFSALVACVLRSMLHFAGQEDCNSRN